MQRHISAVFAEQWMVPLHFFDRVVDIAAMLQRQVRTVSYCTLSSTPVMAQMRIPMVLEILQLQYIDKMVDLCCAGPASSGSGRENQSRSHSYSPFLGPGRSHARCVQRQMPMVDVFMQFIDISHVPVIAHEKCPRFSYRR